MIKDLPWPRADQIEEYLNSNRETQPTAVSDITGRYIVNKVQTCDACQRRGNPKANNVLHLIEPKAPFQKIGIDIVGPLPVIE